MATGGSWKWIIEGTFSGGVEGVPASLEIVLHEGPEMRSAGDTQLVEAVVRDGVGNVMDTPVTWASDNPRIATVEATEENSRMALITTLEEGTVTITASAVVFVKKADPIPTTVTVAPATVAGEVGASVALKVTVTDQSGAEMPDAPVTWAVDDATVAALTASGQSASVALIKAGVCGITAKAGTATTTVAVSVTAPVVIEPPPAEEPPVEEPPVDPAPTSGYAPVAFDFTRSPHSPHAQWQATDFRTSYLEASRILPNRIWLSKYMDVIMSAGHIQQYTDVGLKHIPYTLLFAPFSTDRSGDMLGSSGPYYEKWCADNGRDPEDGYVHLAANAPRYSWPIASIDATGKVTLKYGSRWAFEEGDPVTISSGAINGTYPVSNVSWAPKGEEGLLTFTIPVKGQVTTGGWARNGVSSGQKIAKDRIFLDIAGFPPPRYLINPLSEVRRDFEIWRTQQILATVYSYAPDYKTPGIFVDEVMPNWTAIKDSLEFGAGTNYNTALAKLLGEIYASMKAPQNFLQPNIGSYLNDAGMLISDAAKSVQNESTLNPFQRGIHSSWTWWEQAMAKGVSPVAVGAFSWWDTAPTKWGGGLYANDTKVLGASSIGMQREKIAEYCAYLMVAQPSSVQPHLYCDLWRGSKYDVAGDWESCWLSLFEADIGKPLGARVSMGTFTNGKGLKVRVTKRDFERCVVLVATPDDWNNPDYTDAGAITIPLPTDRGPLHLVHSDRRIDAEPMTSITIRAAEGAILWLGDGTGDLPTEPPIDPPTETPTDPPTDPTTEPPTETPTDPPTETPAEPPAPSFSDFTSAAWTKAYIALSPATIAGPDAAAPVFKLVPTKENVLTHELRRVLDPALADNTQQDFTFVVKAGEHNWFALQSADRAGAAWLSYVDLAAGTLGSVAPQHTIAMEPLADGWYRIRWGFNLRRGTYAAKIMARVGAADAKTPFAGNGRDGLYIQSAEWVPGT